MQDIVGLKLGLPNAAIMKFRTLACPVFESGNLLLGANIPEFKSQFLQTWSTVKGVALLNSSTSAHEVLFDRLVKENGAKNVVFQVNAFPSVCFAAARAGLTVYFVDVDPSTGQVCAESLYQLLGKIEASLVHVTSIGGCVPGNLDKIKSIVHVENALLVEDAAHSYGASRNGIKCGEWADYTVFSFAPTKPLTCGNGGAVAGADFPFIEKLQAGARYGRANQFGNGEFLYPGMSARFNEIDAALGLASLSVFEMLLQKRQKAAKVYKEKLSKLDWLKICDMGEGSWYKFPCLIEGRNLNVLRTYLTTKQIKLSSKVYDELAIRSCVSVGVPVCNDSDKFPGGDKWVDSHFCLPMHSYLSVEDAERVADALLQF